MFGMGIHELMIIGVIAVLLFGKKLPEVARSLGSSYREFKKGLSEFQTHMQFDDRPSYSSSSYNSSGRATSYASTDYEEDDDTTTAPRFEPPPASEASLEATSGSDVPDDKQEEEARS